MNCPAIVIIEDDQDIRESIKDVLEAEGYAVAAFSNGKEAIEKLSACSDPCLILLDIMMPVMNGWEFLQARKALGDTIVAIPVYIVSANATPEDVRRSNVEGYIKKPVDLDILLRIVHGHCGEGH
jgi:CheY-like chemotaxis protein